MEWFKWVGRKKREEDWMREPRRLPTFGKELAEDNIRWQMTQEFVNDEDKNIRVYLAVHQPDPKVERWRIYHVEYDLKRDESYVRANLYDDTTDPMEVVKSLRDYERQYKANPKYVSHPQERGNYRAFANKYGIHFDDDGNVFRVATETPLVQGTFMSRESLDKLFHKEAAKTIPLDSWEGIYKGIVESWSPEWTMTEKAFGLAEQMQAVKAVPVENAYENFAANIAPVATSVWEIATQSGGVVNWKGGAATLPTAQDIVIAKEKLANGTAGKPTLELEAAPVEKPASADVPAPTEKPVAAAVPANDATAPEKPVVPKATDAPLPVAVDGKFVYQHAREKTWGGYKEMQQLTWQRPVTLDDVAAGKGYAEYAHYMMQLTEKLNELPAALTAKTTDKYQKEALVKAVSRYAANIPYRSARKLLAKQQCDATILVGMLRAGAAVYADQFGPGKKFSPDGLQLMSTIGKICVQFAIDRLGVPADEAAKIADVMTKGPDPFGPALPLEKNFVKFPPADFIPAPAPYVPPSAPPKKKPIAQQMPRPPTRRTRGW